MRCYERVYSPLQHSHFVVIIFTIIIVIILIIIKHTITPYSVFTLLFSFLLFTLCFTKNQIYSDCIHKTSIYVFEM